MKKQKSTFLASYSVLKSNASSARGALLTVLRNAPAEMLSLLPGEKELLAPKGFNPYKAYVAAHNTSTKGVSVWCAYKYAHTLIKASADAGNEAAKKYLRRKEVEKKVKRQGGEIVAKKPAAKAPVKKAKAAKKTA